MHWLSWNRDYFELGMMDIRSNNINTMLPQSINHLWR